MSKTGHTLYHYPIGIAEDLRKDAYILILGVGSLFFTGMSSELGHFLTNNWNG